MPDPANVTPAAAAAPLPSVPPALHSVLDRPEAQRLQEFRYRFGQSVVFGLPVLALQWFGRSLGGAESDRWVALLQGLLAGWVVYVAATGVLVGAGGGLFPRGAPPPPPGGAPPVATFLAGAFLFLF